MSVKTPNVIKELSAEKGYKAWLQYNEITDESLKAEYSSYFASLSVTEDSPILNAAVEELTLAANAMLGKDMTIYNYFTDDATIILGTYQTIDVEEYGLSADEVKNLNDEGYVIKSVNQADTKKLVLVGKTDKGVLYAAFQLLRFMQTSNSIDGLHHVEQPKNQFRMMNQWDNMDGSIERGYSGNSIFYDENGFTGDLTRIKDYARLLSSVGINAISINNVNVWEVETNLITSKFLPEVQQIADIFRAYGVQTFLSINFASPIQIGGLATADPLDAGVQKWWAEKVEEIYKYIPDFGGFVVKADSEHRPGPFFYDRDHADGANMLAEALAPFNGVVFWRCFVYNCLQDWRDRSTDRARAAFDHFKPLDGKFLDNVVLQIKNGPMDFQVREPISPLIGSMEKTNQVMEFQVAQEYTGQQKDLCFLVPQWKEYLKFDTHAKGEGTTVDSIVNGSVYDFKYSGITAVSNIGNDANWTGNTLAQANLFGYGRLIWNPDATSEDIADDWVRLTFGDDKNVVETVKGMLLDSWHIYENYNAPLGVGWMINQHHHYGPNIDGYEYDVWGTYHFSDRDGMGVDRTMETGTGYTEQYFSPNKEIYNSLETCPDELLLFFHHVPYTYELKSGKTVIQHIYDTHFLGFEQVEGLITRWNSLEGKMDDYRFNNVKERLHMQLKNAREWRDQINTYFYRKSGVPDAKNRTIY
ncbi:alpha-glucuronidase [Aquibacillus koreensis]|uniref:Xylan alpha-1,2-glucuronidase n=1 Tax=Aquibacillus koreensis TaxID=279446 RepID=A0A9X3WS37_9BACI|nr:alpha-glucuronidase family glycosyl hydrolase [Aquibacillus koreensis]MCT2537017.1 alpha-glucuronidase [Aquibacillus koreensis]MDC3422329.1 alpha-glucuronidase [Aquibacillus koreensis]